MKKRPLTVGGKSDFGLFRRKNYYYIDKTKYIETLEYYCDPITVFLRPRRFGKSLFCSMLEYYYSHLYVDEFNVLFEDTYICENQTVEIGEYAILKFDFSGIDSSNHQNTHSVFLNVVRTCIAFFLNKYGVNIPQKEKEEILVHQTPEHLLVSALSAYSLYHYYPIYIIIDEYDYFANQMLTADLAYFKMITSQKGFLRAFYEIIKMGTTKYRVERVFITGVTPITLDAMTSGFNITMDYTSSVILHDMMGFTEQEVKQLLTDVLKLPAAEQPTMMADLKKWYDGYAFNTYTKHRLYNSAMVLYFIKEYQPVKRYPDELLDMSIASDYGKIKQLFELDNTGKTNYEALQKITATNQIETVLTRQYSFLRPFTRDDFLSMLYYVGFLTIDKMSITGVVLKMPNKVIEHLYLTYFLHWLSEREQFDIDRDALRTQTVQMALHGNPMPFIQQIEAYLHHLSNRDYQNFSEKYIKLLMFCVSVAMKAFYIKSETEHPNGYTDLLFLAHKPKMTKYQYVFELKYLKKKNAKKLLATQKEAKIQLQGYLKARTWLTDLSNLQAYTIVAIKDKLHVEQVIPAALAVESVH